MKDLGKSHEITRLLQAWNEGNHEAKEALWTMLYNELKQMARSVLWRQGGRPHEGSTSLVHQAYLRLLGSDIAWVDRKHFFAVASRAMRFVLVDGARSQLTAKRGGEVEARPPNGDEGWAEVADPARYRPEEVLAVHEALSKLAEINPRHEQLVELRYFAGLSVAETADILGVTSRTVMRDWKSARIWLRHRLETM